MVGRGEGRVYLLTFSLVWLISPFRLTPAGALDFDDGNRVDSHPYLEQLTRTVAPSAYDSL